MFSPEFIKPRRLVGLLFIALALQFAAASLAAQPAMSSTGRGSGEMFLGETLSYEGKLSRLKIGWTIADLTFTTAAGPGPDEMLIRGEATSRGTLVKLLRFSFLQRYDSVMATDDFRILKTIKLDRQKERVRESEAIFDHQAGRVTYVETDPKDPMRPPKRIASDVTPDVLDMITAIYAVRLLPLTTGTRGEYAVSDSGLVYKVPFTVTKRERLNTVLGKINCWRVEPHIFGPGRLIEQEGKMTIWMTDDPRHIPVKAEVSTEFGKVTIKLEAYQKAVQPAGKK
jgi:hypothetical protein